MTEDVPTATDAELGGIAKPLVPFGHFLAGWGDLADEVAGVTADCFLVDRFVAEMPVEIRFMTSQEGPLLEGGPLRQHSFTTFMPPYVSLRVTVEASVTAAVGT